MLNGEIRPLTSQSDKLLRGIKRPYPIALLMKQKGISTRPAPRIQYRSAFGNRSKKPACKAAHIKVFGFFNVRGGVGFVVVAHGKTILRRSPED
jgi:hypothetical protein